MALKRWYLIASAVMAVSLVMMVPPISAESNQAFRQKNGLLIHKPPDWFLRGYFIASEKNPGYVFGPVRDFVESLSGKTAWLIEDMEIEHLKAASTKGEKIEYSLYLEDVSPNHTNYWVFVVLPHENPQAWYDARRAYHGRKAEGYYGKTRDELKNALGRGFNISAELRFWITNGETSLRTPEDVIISDYKFQPVFDLGTGRLLESTTKTQ